MERLGINGFVIGPLIAALFIACWNLLSGKENQDNAEEIDPDFIAEGKDETEALRAKLAEQHPSDHSSKS